MLLPIDGEGIHSICVEGAGGYATVGQRGLLIRYHCHGCQEKLEVLVESGGQAAQLMAVLNLEGPRLWPAWRDMVFGAKLAQRGQVQAPRGLILLHGDGDR